MACLNVGKVSDSKGGVRNFRLWIMMGGRLLRSNLILFLPGTLFFIRCLTIGRMRLDVYLCYLGNGYDTLGVIWCLIPETNGFSVVPMCVCFATIGEDLEGCFFYM